MGNFVEEQKTVNVQLNKRVVESTMNKRIDGFQNEIAQKFDNLQYSISRLTINIGCKKKGTSPHKLSTTLGEFMK